MFSKLPLTDKSKKSAAISVYVKRLGWVAGNSYIHLINTDFKFSVVDRLDVYNIISKYNVPYVTEVTEHPNHHVDLTVVESIYFRPFTETECKEYDKMVAELTAYHSNHDYEQVHLFNSKRPAYLSDLLGLYSLNRETLADEIILTLKDDNNDDVEFIKTLQVTDYLENNPCDNLSNAVCLNYARGLMIRNLSRDIAEINYKDYSFELEVESSMVTLSGEKEFTRITKFKVDEGFYPILMQFATRENKPLE